MVVKRLTRKPHDRQSQTVATAVNNALAPIQVAVACRFSGVVANIYNIYSITQLIIQSRSIPLQCRAHCLLVISSQHKITKRIHRQRKHMSTHSRCIIIARTCYNTYCTTVSMTDWLVSGGVFCNMCKCVKVVQVLLWSLCLILWLVLRCDRQKTTYNICFLWKCV